MTEFDKPLDPRIAVYCATCGTWTDTDTICYILMCEFWCKLCLLGEHWAFLKAPACRRFSRLGHQENYQCCRWPVQPWYQHTCNRARYLACFISCDTLSCCLRTHDCILEQFTHAECPSQEPQVFVMIWGFLPTISKNCCRQQDLG